MNKKILIGIFIVLIIGVATAGAVAFLRPYNPLTPPSVDDTGLTTEGIQEVANANNKFAIDVYKQITATNNDNVFVSPYSISSALAMTYEGANGQTADEMKAVFNFPETDLMRPNFAAVYNIINKEDKQYELRTGNALWIQKDYTILSNYLSTVEKYYGGKAVNLDFINETEKSRLTINSFIEEQTNNKIKNLIPVGLISGDTRLVLTNAIYFKGKWDVEFNKDNTIKREFRTPTESKEVLTMFMAPKPEELFNYFEDEELQAIELPYKDKELSMVIILPKEDNVLTTLEQSLTSEKLNEWTSNLKESRVDEIYFPKFEFDSGAELSEILKDMGMPTVFSASADFSKMTGNRELSIGAVIHKAFIKVDEEGSEAAAATAVVMRDTAVGPGDTPPKTIFKADHPFLFLIKENSTGTILFMGRINDPSS
ncbi:MAG: serpin family protein [archaeon]|jgi:serpin B